MDIENAGGCLSRIAAKLRVPEAALRTLCAPAGVMVFLKRGRDEAVQATQVSSLKLDQVICSYKSESTYIYIYIES